MINKKITYKDFNGVEKTRTCWFHLSKPQLIELETSVDGGFSRLIKSIIDAKSTRGVVENIKKIIMLSYGIRHDEDDRFEQSPEISKAFSETPAYEVLYMQLLEDEDSLAKFINGLVPKDIADKVASMDKAKIEELIENPNKPGLNE